MTNKGMTAYTRWAVAHPWHVTGFDMPIVPDCDCEWCTEERKKKKKKGCRKGV